MTSLEGHVPPPGDQLIDSNLRLHDNLTSDAGNEPQPAIGQSQRQTTPTASPAKPSREQTAFEDAIESDDFAPGAGPSGEARKPYLGGKPGVFDRFAVRQQGPGGTSDDGSASNENPDQGSQYGSPAKSFRKNSVYLYADENNPSPNGSMLALPYGTSRSNSLESFTSFASDLWEGFPEDQAYDSDQSMLEDAR